jgi:hypothetical protein
MIRFGTRSAHYVLKQTPTYMELVEMWEQGLPYDNQAAITGPN